MKTSFTGRSGHKSGRRRQSRHAKDSFVKGGGLGSELEGLKYKPVYQENRKDQTFAAHEEEYDEI